VKQISSVWWRCTVVYGRYEIIPKKSVTKAKLLWKKIDAETFIAVDSLVFSLLCTRIG